MATPLERVHVGRSSTLRRDALKPAREAAGLEWVTFQMDGGLGEVDFLDAAGGNTGATRRPQTAEDAESLAEAS